MQNWTKKRPIEFEDVSMEVQLLLLISRPNPLAHLEQIIKITTSEVDWLRFINLGLSTRLASLVYYNNKKFELNALPENVAQKFKLYQYQLIQFNTHLYADYHLFQKKCNDLGIFCLPIKGIYVAEKLYAENYLRQISDIDLVILPEDHNKIMQILSDFGWKIKITVYKSKFHEEKLSCHTPFNVISKTNALDFHYELFDKGKGIELPISVLSKRLQNDNLVGLEIKRFDRYDLFIYLCLHQYKHLRNGSGIKLSAFADLSHFIHTYKNTFTLKELLERSSEFNLRKEIELMLTFVRRLWMPENDPFFQATDISEFSPEMSRIVLAEFNEIQLPLLEKTKSFVLNRKKEYFHGITIIPLLWFDLFPTSAFLKQAYGKKTYVGSWLKRFLKQARERIIG